MSDSAPNGMNLALDAEQLKETLHTALIQTDNAILITDSDLRPPGPRILWANPAFCAMTGYRLDELLGESPRILQGPETSQETLRTLRWCLEKGRVFKGETTNYRRNGTPYEVEWRISPIHDEAGHCTHYLSVQRDISHERGLQRHMRQLSAALDQTADNVVITDRQGIISYVNRAFERHTGYPAVEAVGRPISLLNSGHHGRDFYRELWRTINRGQPFSGVITNRRRDGSLYYEQKTITPVLEDDRIAYFVSMGKDISDRVEQEQQLRRMAMTDRLTGVANRSGLQARLRELVDAGGDKDARFAVVVFDIDHFKPVNDEHGHLVGDEVLVEVARRVQTRVRRGDLLARWGGEEFVIVVIEVELDIALRIAEAVRRLVAEQPFSNDLAITISAGVACREPGETTDDLLRRADEALYRAKRGGRNRVEAAAHLEDRP